MGKIKKIVILKDYSAERFAKNLDATRKLLKKRGYIFRTNGKGYFTAILMFNQYEGINVRFKGPVTDETVEIRDVKYIVKDNCFVHGYCLQWFANNKQEENHSWTRKFKLGVAP